MLAVAVGAIAVTFAVAVALSSAGKVMEATWPTFTSAMSASAMDAVTVYEATLSMVMKLLPEDDDVDDDEEEPDDDELLDPPLLAVELPPEVVAPTTPPTATTSPVTGDFSVAFARSSFAVVTAVWASSTASAAELTWSLAELICWVFFGFALFALASDESAFDRLLYARVSEVSALVTAVSRSPFFRVPRTSPFLTVAPTATRTDEIVPDVPNETLSDDAGAMDPLAVMLVLTVPC